MKYLCFSIFSLCSTFLIAQDQHCSRTTEFGPANICLPIIDGYMECYPEANIKQLANATELPTNEVLGFYLNNTIYSKKDSLGLIEFDDYFKVYATKQLANQVSDTKFLLEVKELIGGQFISENWDQMEGEIDKLGLEVKVGVPRIIKSYNLGDDSFTFIMLTKYDVPGSEPYTMIMSMNGILVENRLIWMAHYLTYKDENSIKKIQKISDAILGQFLQVNN